MKKSMKAISMLILALASINAMAKSVPGTKEAAAELAREFLPMVTSDGNNRFEVTGVIPQDGFMYVNAGTPVGNERNSCSMKLSRNDTANKYGWVVERYTCGHIAPAK